MSVEPYPAGIDFASISGFGISGAEELSSLIGDSENGFQQQSSKPQPCIPTRPLLATASALITAGGVALKLVNNYSPDPSAQWSTAADLIMGSASAIFAAAALPECISKPLSNETKRWIVPLFEVLTNVYLNIDVEGIHTLLENLFYIPVNLATGGLTAHDIWTIITMKSGDLQEGARREKPLNMLEGDAASIKRTAMNQAAIGALGIALIILGTTLQHHEPLETIFRDAGIITTLYSAGVAAGLSLTKTVECLEKRSKGGQPSLALKLFTGVAKVFQVSYPLAVAMSIAPDTPYTYAVTGFFWGIGTQLTRTLFQTRVITPTDTDDKKGLLARITSVFSSRKKDIALNAVFYSIVTAWTIWGEVSGGTGRVRGGVAALSASTIAGFITSCIVDLKWFAGNSSIINSIYYNLIAQSPATLMYLFMQTKIIANDFFLNDTSPVGYVFGIAALIALGMAIGQDRWLQMRPGRTEPALTPLLGKALLAWTTARRFLGQLK